MPRKRVKAPKMSPADVDKVLRELDAWCRRERVGRLTWERLEDAVGFSRQALSSRTEIAERYGQAKVANRPKSPEKPAPKTADQRVTDLQRKIGQLEALVNRYDERWARYARNAAFFGIDLEKLDQPIDPPARAAVRSVPGGRGRTST